MEYGFSCKGDKGFLGNMVERAKVADKKVGKCKATLRGVDFNEIYKNIIRQMYYLEFITTYFLLKLYGII